MGEHHVAVESVAMLHPGVFDHLVGDAVRILADETPPAPRAHLLAGHCLSLAEAPPRRSGAGGLEQLDDVAGRVFEQDL